MTTDTQDLEEKLAQQKVEVFAHTICILLTLLWLG
jgi:hypothetical protein